MFTFSDSIMSSHYKTEWEDNLAIHMRTILTIIDILASFPQSQVVFGTSERTLIQICKNGRRGQKKGETLEYTSSCLVTLRKCIWFYSLSRRNSWENILS